MSGTLGQVVAVGTAAGGIGWLASLVTVRAQKRRILSQAEKTDADATAVIQKSALEFAAEVKADAKSARAEVKELRSDVRKLEEQLDEALKVGREAVDELRRLKSAILDPTATLGALRDLVIRSARNSAL
jgi:seryl-tRNA synthetase